MIHFRDYVQEVDGNNYASIRHWGMFEIQVPTMYDEYEEDVSSNKLQSVIENDMERSLFMMRRMRGVKEGIAAYANRF